MEQKVTDENLARFCQDQVARAVADDRGLLEIDFTKGPRYARIVEKQPGVELSGSVVCFIRLENGDIHKAASFKAPLLNRGVRGNICTPDRGASCMTGYGPAYLRR